jgi:hypothetical protein
MPIRLNLLAEAQAAEEMRRRDPVKRAIWTGVVITSLMLAWSSSLLFKTMLANGDLGRVEGQLTAHTNEYQQVLAHEQKGAEIKRRVSALKQLAASRFLNGTLLDALQHTTVQDVQLVRLRVDQSYSLADEVKPHLDGTKQVPGKPATATEKVILTLDGNDASPNPGDQIAKLKDVIACNAYFKGALAATNPISLKSLSSPQLAPGTGLPCVLFSLQCRYADKTR